jgi:hypothetical protein
MRKEVENANLYFIESFQCDESKEFKLSRRALVDFSGIEST